MDQHVGLRTKLFATFYAVFISKATLVVCQDSPCSSDPCKNGTFCIEIVDRFICHCLEGTMCELAGTTTVSPDPCLPNPCENGGTCSVAVGGFTCNCPTGYIGDTCSEGTPCSSSPCINNGICRDAMNGGYVCNCTMEYTGVNCGTEGTDVTSPCDPSPCLNNGSCSVTDDVFSCSCARGYTGDTCQQAFDSSTSASVTTEEVKTNGNGSGGEPNPSSGDRLWVIIAIVVAAVIVAFLVILLCFMILRGRSNKSSSTSHRSPHFLSEYQRDRDISPDSDREECYAQGQQGVTNQAFDNSPYNDSVFDTRGSVAGNYDPPPAYDDGEDSDGGHSINGGINKPRIYDNNQFSGINNFNTLRDSERASSYSGSIDNAQLY